MQEIAEGAKPFSNRLPLHLFLSGRTAEKTARPSEGGEGLANQPFNNGPPLRIDLVQRFFDRFSQSPSYAIQQPGGSYIAKHDPPTITHYLQHLAGNWTLATYAAYGSSSKWACIDLDLENGFETLRAVQKALRGQFRIPSLLEASRRGGHLWLFMRDAPRSRKTAQDLAHAIASHFHLDADLFPKGNGLGGCVRVPLGIHRKTGLRYGVWNEAAGRLNRDLSEALEIVVNVPLVPSDIGEILRLGQQSDAELTRIEIKKVTTPSVRVQAIRSLVTLRHLGLSVGRAGLMSCPLHPPDTHPSFHWNEKEKLWCCFHEDPYLGGDIIDLFRRLRGISRSQATDELYRFALREREGKPRPPRAN